VVVEDDLTAPQLEEQLRGRVASFSVPSRWRLQKDPLPTNHSGKVDKTAISAQVRAELKQRQAATAS
jgi:acyl-CoA synthetase (AMP-forming)/AMP-acid ligase II